MKPTTILQLMQQSMPFEETLLDDLQNLLEEYPYFQAGHLIYTLSLKSSKDSRLNAQLRKTAAYVGDRRQLFYRMNDTEFSPAAIAKIEATTSTDSDTASSFDLIDFFLAEKGQKQSPQPSTKELHPSTANTDYLSYFLAEEENESNQVLSSSKPLQHQDAIDKFLAEDEKAPVKIVLKEPAEGEESDYPKLDEIEEDSFFSETLAKIYIKQKKYEQALAIIKQLHLLNPQKNRYFAVQIRYLEKLINNKHK
jgi:tetratricopeptide (TPR) repeat protein